MSRLLSPLLLAALTPFCLAKFGCKLLETCDAECTMYIHECAVTCFNADQCPQDYTKVLKSCPTDCVDKLAKCQTVCIANTQGNTDGCFESPPTCPQQDAECAFGPLLYNNPDCCAETGCGSFFCDGSTWDCAVNGECDPEPCIPFCPQEESDCSAVLNSGHVGHSINFVNNDCCSVNGCRSFFCGTVTSTWECTQHCGSG